MTCKVGQTCDQCFKGKFCDGPFDTEDGPFIYCDKCGYSEIVPDSQNSTKDLGGTNSNLQKDQSLFGEPNGTDQNML